LGVEVDAGAVRRHRYNRSQTTQRADERWDNVEGIFSVKHPERLKGKHILLVDDVFTTGATIMSLGSAILSAVEDARLSVAVLAASRYGLRVKS
jgi:predicted amidophosphoribosyltransferase